jgi:peptide/nickel transport system substrate-binding protein
VLTFELNQDRVPAFKDKRVRLAVAHAVNSEGIVSKIMRGLGTAAGQLSPPSYAGHDPALTPRFDLAKAKALMQEAGYADGFAATMMAPNNRYIEDARVAEAVAAMLAKINIRVDLQTMPKAQYWQRFDERAADIMMIGWQSDTQDSANFYEFLVMTPDKDKGYGQYNAGDYSNPEIDKLTLATQTMTDREARAATLRKIERLIYDDAALIPLHWQHLSWAARNNVKIGAVVNVIDMPYLGDLVIE